MYDPLTANNTAAAPPTIFEAKKQTEAPMNQPNLQQPTQTATQQQPTTAQVNPETETQIQQHKWLSYMSIFKPNLTLQQQQLILSAFLMMFIAFVIFALKMYFRG